LSAFELVRARLLVALKPLPWLLAQLDLEATDVPIVKDAFVAATPVPWLGLVVGQFKKPFSRVRLTNAGKVPLYDRGLVDDRFAGDFGYGGRDLGAMLRGAWGPIRYALSLSNGTRTAPELDAAKDVSTRVTAALLPSVEVGASGSLVARDATATARAWRSYAGAADLRLKIGRVDSVVEVSAAEVPTPTDRPMQVGLVAWALFRSPRIFSVSPRPIVKYELLDDDAGRGQDYAQSVVAGVNLHFDGPLRLLLQGERVFRRAQSSELPRRRFVAQLAFDFKTEVGRRD